MWNWGAGVSVTVRLGGQGLRVVSRERRMLNKACVLSGGLRV